MDNVQRRQLTAILFADIVGYTALMQTDEQQALANLQKFKQELEKLVAQNQGQIIQFYGDAGLVTFNSSADATTCASQLQKAFQIAPKVPVRIGLHSGEVVFKEGNVFGDAVNIASRIESMGVAGAVLLSSSIRNQIKNKSEFSLTPLGKFEFKNIEDAMTVFALKDKHLVIPQKDKLKGKFKEKKETAPAPKANIYPFIIGGLLLALVASLVYIGMKPTTSQAMTTQEVSIVNESGEAETRIVPTAEFTRKFVSFPFEVTLDDPEADWLSLALPILFNNDMEQDMRLSGRSPIDLKSEYDIYNQQFPNPIPFATQIKIAQDFYTDYFVTGKLSKGNLGTYKLTLSVNETDNGKVLHESTAEGDDLFSLIDQVSSNFNKELYLPDAQTTKTQIIDLPVKELITSNSDALENYIKGQILYQQDPQSGQKAIELLEKSIALDPNCADCHYILAQLLFISSNMEEATPIINKARRLAASQPERKQLAIRGLQLNFQQEFQQMVQLFENWRQLYPHDLSPYERLMNFYPYMRAYDKAKEVGLAALEHGHRGTMMTKLAGVYIHTQEYDKAEKLLKEFAELYPHKANKTYELAEVYVAQGKLQEALSFYEKLNVIEVDNPNSAIGLSDIQDRLGMHDAAEKTLSNFLMTARLPQDSMRIHEQLEKHFLRLGKYNPFLENFKQRLAINARIAPPLTRLNIVLFRLNAFVDFQKDEVAEKYLIELENQNLNLKETIRCVGDFMIFYQKKDVKQFNELVSDEDCYSILLKNNGEHSESLVEGVIATINSNYAKAAEQFELNMKQKGISASDFEEELIDIYRLNKDYKKATAILDKLLKSDPHKPKILLAGAKLKLDQNDKTAATEMLQKALAVWSHASPEYKDYLEAVEFGKSKLGLESL